MVSVYVDLIRYVFTKAELLEVRDRLQHVCVMYDG